MRSVEFCYVCAFAPAARCRWRMSLRILGLSARAHPKADEVAPQVDRHGTGYVRCEEMQTRGEVLCSGCMASNGKRPSSGYLAFLFFGLACFSC